MKNFILTFSLFLFSLCAFGQSFSYKTIISKKGAYITEIKNLESNNEISLYSLSAQNSEYKTFVDNFTITTSGAQGLYDFLIKVQKFEEETKDEKNVVRFIDDIKVQIMRIPVLGTSIFIYKDYKHHDFKPSTINGFIKKFKKYCDKKNITFYY